MPLLPRLFMVALYLVSLASGVRAESGDGEGSRAYAAEISTALNEVSLGNFAEAREHFRRAHAMAPSARTYRGLGVVEFELRNYEQATALLEEALASDVRPLDNKLRAETEQLLARARNYIGTVVVELKPRGATLVVDGAATKVEPSQALTLAVGDHLFEAHASGFLTARERVRVNGAETTQLTLTLVPAPESVGAASNDTDPARRAEPTKSSSIVRKWWLWTAVAVVVVGAATAAAIVATRQPHEGMEPVRTGNTPNGATIQTLSWGGR